MKTFHLNKLRIILAIAGVGVLVGVAYVGNPSFFKAPRADASLSENVSGWAWGENVGWLSFNSLDCDSNKDGWVDLFCGGTTGLGAPNNDSNIPVVDYGVKVDTTTKSAGGIGAITGNAWSENIGWVSFDQTDLIGCPSVPCSAQVNWTTGAVTGWARVFVGTVVGDGWIKLSDDANVNGWTGKGVKIYANKFSGYAWDSTVTGWIDFTPKIGGVSVGPRIGVPPCTAADVDLHGKWGACQVLPSSTCLIPPSPTPTQTLPTGGIRVGICSGGGTTIGPCEVTVTCTPPPLPPPPVPPFECVNTNSVCDIGEDPVTCPTQCPVKLIHF